LSSKKLNFSVSDQRSFVIDSLLVKSIKSYPEVKYSILKNTLGKGKYYLYSWQNEDSIKDEFTIIHDETLYELGFSVYYFVTNKKGEIISHTIVAGKASEGGKLYEVYTKVINSNTLLRTEAITEKNSTESLKKNRLLGDTSFSKIIVNRNGEIIINEIKKK
jgi:hypothetical protein